MQRVTRRPLLSLSVCLSLAGLLACGSSSSGNNPGNGSGNEGGAGSSSGGLDGSSGSDDGGSASPPGADGSVAPTDAGSSANDAPVSSSDGSPVNPSPGDAAGGGTAGDASYGDGGPGAYGGDGPDTFTTATFQVPSPNGTFTTTAYIPNATGPFPVVILSSGFFQNGVAYAPYAHRLATWGIITFLRDDPNLGEQTPNVAADVDYMITTWLSAANIDSDAASLLNGKIDTSKIGLAGHSRGGQIALLAGEGALGKIKGVFGLDPVDSATSGNPEARTKLPTIGVPLAFIGETTDSASSSCAPAADNYQAIYMVAVSPAVALTSVGADHTMYEDPANCSFCTLCTAGTAMQTQVMTTAVRYMMAFFARELLGDGTVGPAFQGAGVAGDVSAGTITVVSK